MWIPIDIRFKNLFSHIDTKYVFKTGELDLLLGRNVDNVGANSNGSGKSTIIEAITLAATGEVYRDVNKKEFIRTGAKECSVDWNLVHSVSKEHFRVERIFFNNTKSSIIKLYEDGEELTHMTNPNEANKYVFTKIGISKVDFLNYFVIGQGNDNSFFTSGDIKQKEVIARFSNYEQVDKVIELLKIQLAEENTDLYKKQVAIGKVQTVIDLYEGEIADASNLFETDKQEKLDSKQQQIDKVNASIISVEDKIQSNENKKTEKTIVINKLRAKEIKTEALDLKLKDLKQQLTNLKEEKREANKVITELTNLSYSALKCPKCGETFIPESDLSVELVKDTLTDANTVLETMQQEFDETEVAIDKINEEISDQKYIKSQINIIQQELNSFEDIRLSYEEQKFDFESRLKTYLSEFQLIKKSKPDDSIKDINSKLEIQKAERDQIQLQIDEITEKRDDTNLSLFHFGKTGFKTYLANKSIKSIQDVCNYYLDKLEMNLQVVISGYTVLANGDLRDKIEITVINDGQTKGLINKYSGGERSRIDLCGVIAVNFLINNNSETGGLDLLIFDETGYLDAKGQEEVIKALDKVGSTSILVLHHIENVPYRNKTYVEKQNKISRIVEYTEPLIDSNIQKLFDNSLKQKTSK